MLHCCIVDKGPFRHILSYIGCERKNRWAWVQYPIIVWTKQSGSVGAYCKAPTHGLDLGFKSHLERPLVLAIFIFPFCLWYGASFRTPDGCYSVEPQLISYTIKLVFMSRWNASVLFEYKYEYIVISPILCYFTYYFIILVLVFNHEYIFVSLRLPGQ